MAASLAWFALSEIRALRGAGASPTAGAPVEIPASAKLVVYYFAEGKDCATCERIPVFAKAVLDRDFAKELAAGVIVWRPVDVDARENEHFIGEYRIYTKSIVLQQVAEGKPGKWENLEKVWDLVYDEKGFEDYVRERIRAMMGGA